MKLLFSPYAVAAGLIAAGLFHVYSNLGQFLAEVMR